MTKHLLGVLGVIAASVLLAVSAMMNYRFGYSLGKTPSDGHIYGLASAAADCFKALVPFFFFAALRNRMWSQAAAAALVWVVVTGYAMTSALGHAALNRLDTSGQRAAASASYKDLRAELKRAQDQLTWIPAHRPPETVAAELNVLKAQRAWLTTKECTDATIRSSREFCQQYFKLSAEHASGLEAQKLEVRVAEIGAQAAKATGATVMAEADPQASVLARIIGVELEKVQTGLTVFVALLIEIGSGFGMYVAFAYWRMHGPAPAAPAAPQVPTTAATRQVAVTHDAIWSGDVPATETIADAAPPAEPPIARSRGDNDNQRPAQPSIMPPDEVQRFYRERVEGKVGSNETLNDVYKAYCEWSDEQGKNALPMPTFSRDFKALGVRKARIGGRVRYIDIELRPRRATERDSKLPALVSEAA